MDNTNAKVTPLTYGVLMPDSGYGSGQDGPDTMSPMKNETQLVQAPMVPAKTRPKSPKNLNSSMYRQVNQAAPEREDKQIKNRDLPFNQLYQSPQDYLKDICYTFDCANDLDLYEIDRSIASVEDSSVTVIGIRLKSQSLQQIYQNKKYLFRCYVDKEKIYEIPIDDEPQYFEVGSKSIIYSTNEENQKLKLIYFGDVPLKIQTIYNNGADEGNKSGQNVNGQNQGVGFQMNIKGSYQVNKKQEEKQSPKSESDSDATGRRKAKQGKKVTYQEEEEEEEEKVEVESNQTGRKVRNKQTLKHDEDEEEVESDATGRKKNKVSKRKGSEEEESEEDKCNDSIEQDIRKYFDDNDFLGEINQSIQDNYESPNIINIPMEDYKALGRIQGIKITHLIQINELAFIVTFLEEAVKITLDLAYRHLRQFQFINVTAFLTQRLAQSIENTNQVLRDQQEKLLGLKESGKYNSQSPEIIECQKRVNTAKIILEVPTVIVNIVDDLKYLNELNDLNDQKDQKYFINGDQLEQKQPMTNLDITKCYDFRYNNNKGREEQQYIVETWDHKLYLLLDRDGSVYAFSIQLIDVKASINIQDKFKLTRAIISIDRQLIFCYQSISQNNIENFICFASYRSLCQNVINDLEYKQDLHAEAPNLYRDCLIKDSKIYIASGAVISVIDFYNFNKQKHYSLQYQKIDPPCDEFDHHMKQLFPYHDSVAIMLKNSEIWALLDGKLKYVHNPLKDVKIDKVYIDYCHQDIAPFFLVSDREDKSFAIQTFGSKLQLISSDLDKDLIEDIDDLHTKEWVFMFNDSSDQSTQRECQMFLKKKYFIEFSNTMIMPDNILKISTTFTQKYINGLIYFFKTGKIDKYDPVKNQLLLRIKTKTNLRDILCYKDFYLYFSSEEFFYFSDIHSLENEKNSEQFQDHAIASSDQEFDFKYDQTSKSFVTFQLNGIIKVIPSLHEAEREIKFQKNDSSQMNGMWLYGNRLFIYTVDNILQEWNLYTGKYVDQLQITTPNEYIFYRSISRTHLLYNDKFMNNFKIVELVEAQIKEGKSLKNIDQASLFKQIRVKKTLNNIDYFVSQDLSIFAEFNKNEKFIQIYYLCDLPIQAPQPKGELKKNPVEAVPGIKYLFEQEKLKDADSFQQVATNGQFYLNQVPCLKHTESYKKLSTKETQLMQKTSHQLKQLKGYSKKCIHFVSDTHVAFVSKDNTLIGYNISTQKEDFQLVLQSPKEVLRSDILESLLNCSNLISFWKDQYLYNHKNKAVFPNPFNQEHFKSTLQVGEFMEMTSQNSIGIIYKNKRLQTSYSYTYYIWRLFGEISSQVVNIQNFDLPFLQELLKIQLSCGKTLLHCVQFQEEAMKYLFDYFSIDEASDKLFLPILRDSSGKNIFDYYWEEIYLQYQPAAHNTKFIIKMIKFILPYLENYPLNSFHVNTNGIIDILLSSDHKDEGDDILSLSTFLLSRCKTCRVFEPIDKGQFDELHPIIIFSTSQLYTESEAEYRSRFGSQKALADKIEIKVLDLPDFYHYLQKHKKKKLFEFYEKIMKTKNNQIILNPIIKGIIELNWSYMKNKIYTFVIAPFIMLMVVFYIYTIYDLENIYTVSGNFWGHKHQTEAHNSYEETNWNVISQICRIVMLLLVLYFTIIELSQVAYDGFWSYINSLTNIMELSLYALIGIAELLAAITRYSDLDKGENLSLVKVIRTIYSIATLLIWIKFLYIFRTRRSTGYYVRMLMEVLLDIFDFMTIFVAIIICFAQAFYIFFLNSQEDVSFDTMFDAIVYSYFLPFGQFNTSVFGDYMTFISWFYFGAAQIILMIVMLNLLIAIVNDTFSRIKGNYQIYMYRDMLVLPYDNRFLYMFMLKFKCKCRCLKSKNCCRKAPKIRAILNFFIEESSKNDKYLVFGIPKSEDSKAADPQDQQQSSVTKNNTEGSIMENKEVKVPMIGQERNVELLQNFDSALRDVSEIVKILQASVSQALNQSIQQ